MGFGECNFIALGFVLVCLRAIKKPQEEYPPLCRQVLANASYPALEALSSIISHPKTSLAT
jgi:hypothetical protein